MVDDGSTDSTAQIVRGYAPEVRLIEQEQRGHPAARNAGIRAAAGEFLAFLDHDDLWSPDKLELQLASFERNPALDLVFGHIQNFFTPEMTRKSATAWPFHCGRCPDYCRARCWRAADRSTASDCFPRSAAWAIFSIGTAVRCWRG